MVHMMSDRALDGQISAAKDKLAKEKLSESDAKLATAFLKKLEEEKAKRGKKK